MCDAEITRDVGGLPEASFLKEALEATARNPFAEKCDLRVTVEKESAQPVGHCGLVDKEVKGRLEFDLCYFFAVSAWGKGCATEIGAALIRHARAELGLERIIALITPDNSGSQRVALKLGLRLEREVIRPGNPPAPDDALESGAAG